MNILTQTVAVSVLLLVTASTATAEVSADIVEKIKAAAGPNSSLRVTVEGDVVTFSGYTKDSFAMQKAIRVAQEKGANRVLNYAVVAR